MDEKKNKGLFKEAFDVFFIMMLCFATLLVTILMQGGVLIGGSSSGIHYSIKIGTLLIVVAAFVLYLSYIISQSEKELKSIIEAMFKGSAKSITANSNISLNDRIAADIK